MIVKEEPYEWSLHKIPCQYNPLAMQTDSRITLTGKNITKISHAVIHATSLGEYCFS